MNEQEKKLFRELCCFRSDSFDESLLTSASPHVLGQLFFNRMQGIAYGRLQEHGLLNRVNREFRNSLKMAYEKNKEQNRSYFHCLQMVAALLSDCPYPVVMLKGAQLCARYPEGYRTSNDIDLLVLPQHVTQIGDRFLQGGFRQGHIRNGAFVPASRRDIIESKMMRGETVPYIKKVDLPGIPYLEIDINFSLNYKNDIPDLVNAFLNNACTVQLCDASLPTLSKEDFFLHLCAHLYKEATTLPWVEMRRDMTLYKYADLYLLLSEMTENEIEAIFARGRELGMDKILAYAILETVCLFNMKSESVVKRCRNILKDSPSFLLQVESPQNKKVFRYQTEDTFERFFLDDRLADLKEVNCECNN